MNFPDRVTLVDDIVETPAYALVVLISAKEAEGVFNISDVSVRVPLGYPVLPVTGSIRVESGPLVGTYNVSQVRPNRHHTRYVVGRATT